jgi:transcriptional regulator with XRE-family HTH domain
MNRTEARPSTRAQAYDDVPLSDTKGSPRLGLYLRSLRNGYGYSLRKVEEKARLHGGEIDNSQLSRYEKGLCYPSFDKLRALARIFNVSIQTFSDVVDLEELEKSEPTSVDPDELMKSGNDEWLLGDYARAYCHFQKARRILESQEEYPNSPTTANKIAKARLAAAIQLYRLGKISLSEYEIRQLLRLERHIEQGTAIRALLQLSNVHRDFGDFLLAEVEAQRALQMAERSSEIQLQAYAHHALGSICQEREEHEQALHHFHAALARYRDSGDLHGALKVKRNLGPIYAARGQFREGVRLLKEARDEARSLGQRRTVASSSAWLAEIHFRRGDLAAAKQYIRESNIVASGGDVHYVDILFLNAFYQWKIAIAENSPSEAKIALGRLKYLRPNLEHNLPEVREFDSYIEKGGAR